jgi:hypothetical protein
VEQYLSRDEIIRRAKARLGFSTNAGQSALAQAEFEELARAAALFVYSDHEWGITRQETRVTVGIDQTVIDYPAGTTASDLISAAIWDGTRYVPLLERFIPSSMTQDPLVDEGEPASVANRAMPRYYEKRGQILIAPRPDQEYEIKLVHTMSPDLATGATVSIVDAELIILRMIRDKRAAMGDMDLSQMAAQDYAERRAILVRRSSSAHAVQRNAGYRADCNRRLAESGYVPNSGQWPSVMPES